MINAMLRILLLFKKKVQFSFQTMLFQSSIHPEDLPCLVCTELSWKVAMALSHMSHNCIWTDVEEQVEVTIKIELEQN